jgi:hypothetical protein
MQLILLIPLLFAQADASADEKARIEYLRKTYQADAERYEFQRGGEKMTPLELVEKPVMRWSQDDDWSGDVFVWTHDGAPEIIGCMLSGPGEGGKRLVFHEFHLLAPKPIAPLVLQTKRRWEPKEGIARDPVPGAPEPAATAAGRLTQMRQMMRQFTAHMDADNSNWELRALPQPLYRYGDEKSEIVDGALFTYVWSKGTDPEVILLLECLKQEGKQGWYFAPIRFSNRALWLKHDDKEVWRVEGYHEPKADSTDKNYTTNYVRTIPNIPEP